MWKEAVVGYFKILSQNLIKGNEENHEKPIAGNEFEI
jgi:hypothetical protein